MRRVSGLTIWTPLPKTWGRPSRKSATELKLFWAGDPLSAREVRPPVKEKPPRGVVLVPLPGWKWLMAWWTYSPPKRKEWVARTQVRLALPVYWLSRKRKGLPVLVLLRAP